MIATCSHCARDVPVAPGSLAVPCAHVHHGSRFDERGEIVFGNALAGAPCPVNRRSYVDKERVREVSVTILLDTSRRHECPKFAREQTETATEFADRVRALLIQMQGKIE